MLLRPEYLSQNLDRPLPTKDGGTLHTIGQAVEYMTKKGSCGRIGSASAS
jgi:hypothetical protein